MLRLHRRIVIEQSVTCLNCHWEIERCNECLAWQAFLFSPCLCTFLDLKRDYLHNYETDMVILVRLWDKLVQEKQLPNDLPAELENLFSIYRQ